MNFVFAKTTEIIMVGQPVQGEDILHRSFLFFLRDLCELDKVRIMNRLQAYKFQLKTTAGKEFRMWPLAGSCQLVWNRAFAL
jgi:hypothetical protein